jgi:protein gp37
MENEDKGKVADFATFAEKLQKLVQEEFGGPAEGDAKLWRKKLIIAVGRGRSHREQLGMLLVQGRKHFKKDRVWLRVVELVKEAIGYRSRRSIETLMDDATRARGLRNASADRYQALESCGVIAAETRWASLIDELCKDIPENESAKDARQKVDELYEAFKPPKKSGKAPPVSKVERLNLKIERLVVQLFGELPEDQREGVIQKIVAEATMKADDAAAQKASPASTQTLNAANSQPVLVVANDDKDKPTIERATSSGSTIPLQSAAHPWGDAFLGSLVSGPRKLDPLEFNDKALHRALHDKRPQRFFVGDIVAGGLSNHIAERHLQHFHAADWHTYLVLSTNIRRLVEISNGANELELPENLWIGACITSTSDFDQFEILGDLKTPNKFVSLLPFNSGKPIREVSPAFEEVLRKAGVRWVVFGGDQLYGWDISENDEDEIVRASHAAGCQAYCTSAQTIDDFIRSGRVNSKSIPGIFSNNVRRRKTWKLRELPDFAHATLSLSA